MGAELARGACCDGEKWFPSSRSSRKSCRNNCAERRSATAVPSRGDRGLRSPSPNGPHAGPRETVPAAGGSLCMSSPHATRWPWGNRSAAGSRKSPVTLAGGWRDPPRLPTRVRAVRRGGRARSERAGRRARHLFALARRDQRSHEQQQRGVSSALSAVSACFSS